MRSGIIKRSVIIAGHKTSISLEDAFWRGLKEICDARGITLSAQVQAIDGARQGGNLSSAVRLFVLDHFRNVSGTGLQAAQPKTNGMHSPAGRSETSDLQCAAARLG